MKEITRMYLVSSELLEWVRTLAHIKSTIKRYYLKMDSDEIVYCTSENQTRFTKTIKRRDAQESFPIGGSLYQTLKVNAIGKSILKEVYKFTHEGKTYRLSCYRKELEGVCLLSMSMVHDNEHPHREILPFVIRALEDDQRYEEHNLVRYSLPKEYHLDTHLAYLDAHEAPNLFFWQVAPDLYAYDGIALLLYKNARLIRYYQQSFLKKHFMASLHRMRVLFRRSVSLMLAFECYIDPTLLENVIPVLQQLHERTKRLRYLYFIEDLYTSSNIGTLFLHTELKTLILEEEKKAVECLNDRSMFQAVEQLSAPKQFLRTIDYLLLDQVAKEVIFVALRHFKESLAETLPEQFDAHVDILYERLDTLQTLMEDLHHIIGDHRLLPLKEEMNLLYKPLREYRNCIERRVILLEIQQRYTQIDIVPLSCAELPEIKERVVKAIKLLKTSSLYL